MKNSRLLIPSARIDDLVIQEVEGETLVYDLKTHKAHCLNPTAAIVWKSCDGRSTAAEVARKVWAETGTNVSEEVVWLAVGQLEKTGLLQETVARPLGERRMSRREVARRLGVATALALPFIASINAPAAIQAASCGDIEAFCGPDLPPCCSGLECRGGSCLPPIPP